MLDWTGGQIGDNDSAEDVKTVREGQTVSWEGGRCLRHIHSLPAGLAPCGPS